jgi:hypothetical protein
MVGTVTHPTRTSQTFISKKYIQKIPHPPRGNTQGEQKGNRVGGTGMTRSGDPVGGTKGEQEGLAPWGRDVIFNQINKTHGR